MTINELLEKLLPFMPQASIEEDVDGQVVIYTGLRAGSRVLVPIEGL